MLQAAAADSPASVMSAVAGCLGVFNSIGATCQLAGICQRFGAFRYSNFSPHFQTLCLALHCRAMQSWTSA